MSFISVEHNYGNYANRTLNYIGTDQVNAIKNAKENIKWHNSGWQDDTKIEYRLNSHGFRADEFDFSERIICLGDSRTFGVGLHAWQTWPYLLKQVTKKPVWNLASGSACIDTLYRILKCYLPQLHASLVIGLMPTMEKFEMFTDTGRAFISKNALGSANIEVKNFSKIWFQSSENSKILYEKNIEAMSYLCQKHNVKYHWISKVEGHKEKDDCSRCGSHAGFSTHKQIANYIFDQLNA